MLNNNLGQFKYFEEIICIDNTLHRLVNKKTFWLKKWITFCGKKTRKPDWIATIEGMILDGFNSCIHCRVTNANS